MFMEIPDIVKHPINSLEIRASWVGERFAEEGMRPGPTTLVYGEWALMMGYTTTPYPLA
jgi:hypothetical protein